MNSPTCPKCDCVKGCQSNPVLCPNLLAECIASGQVSAYQIEQHRALDAAIAQPEQPAPVAWQWLDTGTFRKTLPKTAVVSDWNPLFKNSAHSAQPEQLTGDQIRQIVRSAKMSASDPVSPAEYVIAGFRFAIAQPKQQARTLLEDYDLQQSPEYHKGREDGRTKGYEAGYRYATEKFSQPEQPAPAPGYCKNCKDYTIEEPLPAPVRAAAEIGKAQT